MYNEWTHTWATQLRIKSPHQQENKLYRPTGLVHCRAVLIASHSPNDEHCCVLWDVYGDCVLSLPVLEVVEMVSGWWVAAASRTWLVIRRKDCIRHAGRLRDFRSIGATEGGRRWGFYEISGVESPSHCNFKAQQWELFSWMDVWRILFIWAFVIHLPAHHPV
jgi:hypothetical protein